jgi:tetrahydromethanopterin S-methyltransferase subunit A
MGPPVKIDTETRTADGLTEGAAQLQAAADAKKCWACGCLRHALDAIDRAVSEPSRPSALAHAMASVRARLVPQRYECLGCEVCYPAVALNALGAVDGCAVDAAECPTEPVEAREGWPPLPGSYRVLRYRAPVAVCTLNNEELVDVVAATEPEAIAIAGTLQT